MERSQIDGQSKAGERCNKPAKVNKFRLDASGTHWQSRLVTPETHDGYSQSSPLGSSIFSESAWSDIARSLNLSARELQITKAVFDDRTEFAIAAQLQISPHTVHTYFDRLYQKLAVKNRIQLVMRVTARFLSLATSPQAALLPIGSSAPGPSVHSTAQ
ncbi:MAG: hypothetical protein C5B50_29940 [Verrucomicrobia bacterium]|nr:MAG: hypothetical protein C5B50_29940 [Verrucomicrobiota bacterium]